MDEGRRNVNEGEREGRKEEGRMDRGGMGGNTYLSSSSNLCELPGEVLPLIFNISQRTPTLTELLQLITTCMH